MISLLLFVWGVNYLKGKDVFSRQIVFYAVYDNVGGLLETNPVSVSGVNIGQVDRIAFHPDGSGRVVVRALIDRQINIPVNSEAIIAATDIFGFKGLEVNLGNDTNTIKSGDTLTGFFKASPGEVITDEFDKIKDQASLITAQVDSVLTSINSILSTRNRTMFDNIVQNLEISTATLNNTMQHIDMITQKEADKLSNIMTGIESIVANFEDNNETIDQVIKNLADVSDILVSEEFVSAIENAGEAMESLRIIMHNIEQGKGTAGLIMQDETLYHKLTESSEQLELLLEDIRENPGKYFRISVFGR